MSYQIIDLFLFYLLSPRSSRDIHFHLSTLVETNKLLHSSQSGFRTSHSTETTLLGVTERLRNQLDSGETVALILLDLSAAFDTISHHILTNTLSSLGIQGSALTWIASFLSNSTFQICSAIANSDIYPLPHGVPQDSILSPLLFNLYVRPLADIAEQVGLTLFTYADDSQIIFSLSNTNPGSPSPLQSGLRDIAAWMSLNMLKLN